VTDSGGCFKVASTEITVYDALMVNAPANTIASSCETQANIDQQFDTWLAGFSTSGGVNPMTVKSPINPAAPSAEGGVTTVTWTVTDDCGSIITSTSSFTVNTCIRVSGTVRWYRDNTLQENVSMSITSATGSGLNGITDASGNYEVKAYTAGNAYDITPSKTLLTPVVGTGDLQSIHNIDVYDVQAIQAHVGGGTAFTSIYQRAAANVVLGSASAETNNRITGTDASALSQAINGLANQQARLVWRFVPSDYVLSLPPGAARSWGLAPEANSPSGSVSSYGKYPEKRTYSSLSSSLTGQDFTAIKVGDVVTGSTGNPLGDDADVRYAGSPLVWRVTDVELREGEIFEATFTADQMTDLVGWQFGLHFDPEYLEIEGLTTTDALKLDPEVNFGLYQSEIGDIRSLWAEAAKTSLPKGKKVFTLRFRALKGGLKLSDVLGLNDDVLSTFALSESLERVAVVLSYDGVYQVPQTPVLHQNTPNPFSKETRVRFELPVPSDIQLSIHDINGRLIKELNGFYKEGMHEVRFGRGELGDYAGVLYYTLRCGEFTETRKMVVIK